MQAYKNKGFVTGLILFVAMLFMPTPEGLTQDAWKVAAVVVLMAVWWATEELAQRHKLDLPISEQVYAVLYAAKPARTAVEELLARSLKHEAD